MKLSVFGELTLEDTIQGMVENLLPTADVSIPVISWNETRGSIFSGRLIARDWFLENGTFSSKGMLALPSTKTIIPLMNMAKDFPTSTSIVIKISFNAKKNRQEVPTSTLEELL